MPAKYERTGFDPDSPPYDKLRAFLKNAFTPRDLRRFCRQHARFKDLVNYFGPDDGIHDMIDEVFDYCDTRFLWDEFLDAVAERLPERYNRFAAQMGWSQLKVMKETSEEQPEKATEERTQRQGEEPAPWAEAPHQPDYADVEIHVDLPHDNVHPVHIQTTTLAGDARGTLVWPPPENELLRAPPRLDEIPVDLDVLADLGRQLFRALFDDPVRAIFQGARSIVEADQDVDRGLRLRLWFESHELQLWPWELMYDEREEFLALSGQTLITRYLSVRRSARPLTVTPPLKVLVAAAAPEDQQLLNVEDEVLAVQAALKPLVNQGLVQIDVLHKAQRMNLLETLQNKRPHVLHFIGHGTIIPTGGVLLLEDENRKTDPLDGPTLGDMLRRRGVRLAVLNACLTAPGAEAGPATSDKRRRALLGVGPALVNAGLGAVVAMQFPLSERAARIFSQVLYKHLGNFASVDQAVSLTREALSVATGRGSLDWATPVLFMRVKDGRLFALPKGMTRPEPARQEAELQRFEEPAPIEASEDEQKPDRAPSQRQYLAHLRRILDERFTPRELNDLCFDMDVDDANLGPLKADKARGLIQELDNQRRISELVEWGERFRPDIDWRPNDVS